MDRATMLKHLRVTHFESGDRERALADAQRIATYLFDQGARRVVGVGSTFDATRPFTDRSDIDLVVAGIEPQEFYAVSARAAALTDFTLDLTPFENMTASFRRDLDQYGVDL